MMRARRDRTETGRWDIRDRIDGYLKRSGLASRAPRVVPLTGDASDRRYFRLLLPDAASIVLSRPREGLSISRRCRSSTSHVCLAAMPVPIPRVIGHADDLGVLALEDLGDVTLQAHLGAATADEHAALYRQSVALIATLQKRGAELAAPRLSPVFERVRRREAHVGDGFFHQALSRRLSRRLSEHARAHGAARTSSPFSSRHWRRSRASCVTATITAGT